jgi:hypothetical protein
MKHTALFMALLLAIPAFAAAPRKPKVEEDDDKPIPYSEQEEDDDRRRDLPRKSDATPSVREETEIEKKDREETLTHLDDPNIGLAVELVAGVMLLDASRGVVGEARFLGGARFTWEFARLIPDEFVREMFFLDVMYAYTEQTEGTEAIWVNTNYHYVAIAPALALPFGAKSPAAFFIQGGFGFNVQPIVVSSQADQQTMLAGTKFLFQYGGGFRFRPALVSDEKVRLSFRIEFTRFRRGYMDDTFLGGSMGLSF